MEIIRLFDLKRKVSLDVNTKAQECEHEYVMQNDDGWYVCTTCHEELRYDPNKPPVCLSQLYLYLERREIKMKNLTKWLGMYNIPFEEELLDEFYSFILKYEELFPERKNLISKENIMFHMLRKRDYQVILKLPKMMKTLAQNEEICRTIFEALNWSFSPTPK